MQKEVNKFVVIPRKAFDLHRSEGLSSSGLTAFSLFNTVQRCLTHQEETGMMNIKQLLQKNGPTFTGYFIYDWKFTTSSHLISKGQTSIIVPVLHRKTSEHREANHFAQVDI